MSAPDLRPVVASAMTEVDKAVVALHLLSKPGSPVSAAIIASNLEAAGSPKINRARLRDRLVHDKRAIKDGDGFRIAPRRSDEVSQLASPLIGPVRPSDTLSVLDSGLFEHAHLYIRNIAHQINISYDSACFDCAAVMIRRLFETLLIEAFEKQGAIAEITGPNGDLLTLSGVIGKLSSTKAFTVSRQTKQAAPHLKDIGDWSAHSRRYQARKSDIDTASKHIRMASSDLLHLAGQAGNPN